MAVCNLNIGTGAVYHITNDFFFPGRIPLEFIRDYDSSRLTSSEFGHGWSHNHTDRIVLDRERATYISGEGRETQFPHPDFAVPTGQNFTISSRREGDTIILEDLKGNRLRFDRLGRMVAQIDTRGNEISYTWGAGGALRSITDTLGRRIEFTTTLGRVTLIEVVMPWRDRRRYRLAEFNYSAEGDLIWVRDRKGATTLFRYDRHLLVEHTNPLGGVTYFQHDGNGRCIQTFRNGRQHERRMIRDDATNSVIVHDSRGAVWHYRFNEQMKPLEEVDPLGNRRIYHYDEQGNLLLTEGESDVPRISIYNAESRQLINQVGSLTNIIQYDEKLRVIAEVNALGAQSSYAYNDRSECVEYTDVMGASWQFEYEADGWLAAAIDPRGHRFLRVRTDPLQVEFRDPIGRNATLKYNSFGLVEESTDALGHATKLLYGQNDQVVGVVYADGNRYGFQYDPMGNITGAQPEQGAPTLFEYDHFGALTTVTNPLGHRASYAYDSEGNMVQVRNGKGETARFDYDLGGRMARLVSFDGRSESYKRDARGQVVEVQDENANVIVTLERDPFGRLTKKIFPTGWEVEMAWGDHGELLMVRNPDAVVKFEWRPDLRVAAEHVNDFSVFYEYDAAGNRASLRTNTGRELFYEWDARNRLVRMLDRAESEYRFTYYDDNLFHEWITSGIVQTFQFDERHRMIRRIVVPRSGQTPVADRRYAYDVRGRLVEMQDLTRGSFAYRYSELDAIVEVLRGGLRVESYSYDPSENCTNTADGQAIRFSVGNRMIEAGARRFRYDSKGSVIQIDSPDQHWELEYDPEGHLRKVRLADGREVEYRYDPFGRRLSKAVAGQTTEYFWDRGVCIQEKNVFSGITDYLFLPDTFLPIALVHSGARHAFVLDQAGTPTELVDEQGRIVWAASSSAFGMTTVATGAIIRNPIRFQGHYSDDETGFHYNFCRYYDPSCARYISQDPVGLDAQANLYRYVLNPLGEVDPYGLATLVNGVLTIVPICGWSAAQEKEARKKMDAMNNKIGKGIKIPKTPVPRCGKSAKEIYEDCQKKVNKPGKPPALPNLNESTDKCSNEQADHMLEICAGGGEEDCDNLQPLNESVNKSFGSQVGSIVRENPGKVIKKVQLHKTECTDRPSVNC